MKLDKNFFKNKKQEFEKRLGKFCFVLEYLKDK